MSKESNERIKQVLVIVAVIGMIAFNWLAQALPLAGRTTGEVSAEYTHLLTPAGYAFSVWSVIYIGLAAFGVYQALPAQTDNPRFQRIRTLVIINAAANCLWLYFWHNELIAASLLMSAVMLSTLVLIVNNLEVGKTVVSAYETWTTRVPFNIYFGWATVAIIGNATIALLASGFNGASVPGTVWAVSMLVVTLLIAAFVYRTFGSPAYVLTIAWGLAAIAFKQQSVNSAAAVAAAIAAIAAALSPLVLKGGSQREQSLKE